VAIIKRLLRGEEVSFAGQHYRVSGHIIAPLPLQKPHPPILIGGNGEHLLALAAREADIVGLSGITFRDGGTAAPDLSGWRGAGRRCPDSERRDARQKRNRSGSRPSSRRPAIS
jgi:alkanesulfonate monooxygenase SsuD/methylene tetrahydromethanopterin reductase-like flavin-dependent oxidoreductase (luciferase family)